MNKTIYFLYKTALIISFIILIFLSFAGLFFTSFSLNMESQTVSIQRDSIWRTALISLALFFIAFCLLNKFKNQLTSRNTLILELVVLFVYFLVGIGLILFGRTIPAADAMSIYAGATSLADGEFSVFSGPDSYFSYYPFQLGLTTLEGLFIRIWKLFPFLRNIPAYHGMKVLYVGFTMLSVHLIKRISDLLWHSQKTTCICLLMLLCNLPLMMYSSFVYGEIPGLCAYLFCFYFTLRLVQKIGKHPKTDGAFATVFAGLSILIRKNSMILIIALLIIVVLEILKQKSRKLILLFVAITLSSFLLPRANQAFYEHKISDKIPSGVTSLSYIAMGMQEASRGAGWYNGFNFLTYQEANLDSKIANEISLKAIRESLHTFSNNFDYTLDFYWRKLSSLWCDGTYACRQATLACVGNRAEWLTKLYSGKNQIHIINWCNIYQNFLYIGALLFVFSILRRKNPAEQAPFWEGTFLICLIGGFLFHLLWEANSRYVFTYATLLVPTASRGLSLSIRKKIH